MAKPLHWAAIGSFTALVPAGDEKLGLSIIQTGRTWTVIAVETTGDDVVSVLDSHAHRALGTFSDVPEAFAVCEKYAAEWLAGKRADACECEEIEALGGEG